ncbi:hypothetical protein GGI25_004123 [Coemansia spiralis]|uniref:CHCH domain-containing protein n=2 Tax=Coemansia TaxID=4863 RepID=A0A9W8G4S6_9FUNG|nr:hypothetical protein BX070DRAFT_228769 [Coemansia spiralis]KAJ1990617.1 hypothetical protein EDC05_003932 [Coemansia umbellata]KAJ2675074.1 hypothetical protein GGI25_004123 [Coemansia spiralis]
MTSDSAEHNTRETEGDEWDERIKRTGCFAENEQLLVCHFDTGDWRKCLKEMAAFKECMRNIGGSKKKPKSD